MQCVYGLIIWPWSFGGNAYCTTIKTSDNPFHMCGRIYICNNTQQPQPWYYGVKIIIRISPPQITHTIVYWTVSFIAFGIQYVLHEEGKLGFWIFEGRVNIILNPKIRLTCSNICGKRQHNSQSYRHSTDLREISSNLRQSVHQLVTSSLPQKLHFIFICEICYLICDEIYRGKCNRILCNDCRSQRNNIQCHQLQGERIAMNFAWQDRN